MSAFSDLLPTMRAETYALYGDAATWSGISDPVTVIRTSPDKLVDFGQSFAIATAVVLKVRVAEVAEPKDGDTVMIGTAQYELAGSPLRNKQADEWICPVEPIG
jgi:hypothetical protein